MIPSYIKIKELLKNKRNIANIEIGTEFETGRIISGKKEYATILNLGAVMNNATASASFPVNNKEIISISGIGCSQYNGQYVAVPSPNVDCRYNGVNISVTNNKGFDLETFVHITICYIKK